MRRCGLFYPTYLVNLFSLHLPTCKSTIYIYQKKKSTIYSILSTRVSFWTIEITKERPKRRVVSPYSSVWLAPINFININQRPPLQKAATTPDSRFVPIKILHLTSPLFYFSFLCPFPFLSEFSGKPDTDQTLSLSSCKISITNSDIRLVSSRSGRAEREREWFGALKKLSCMSWFGKLRLFSNLNSFRFISCLLIFIPHFSPQSRSPFFNLISNSLEPLLLIDNININIINSNLNRNCGLSSHYGVPN